MLSAYRPLDYPSTDVILLCFSVSNPDSLDSVVNKWEPEVRHNCPNAPVILVGTNKELRTDARDISRSSLTPVTTEQGQKIAKRIQARAYVECSARTGEGVQEVFETAARATTLQKCKRRINSRTWFKPTNCCCHCRIDLHRINYCCHWLNCKINSVGTLSVPPLSSPFHFLAFPFPLPSSLQSSLPHGANAPGEHLAGQTFWCSSRLKSYFL